MFRSSAYIWSDGTRSISPTSHRPGNSRLSALAIALLAITGVGCGIQASTLTSHRTQPDDAILVVQLSSTQDVEIVIAREGSSRGITVAIPANEPLVFARRVHPGRYWIATVRVGPRVSDRRYTNYFVVEPGRVTSLGTVHFEVARTPRRWDREQRFEVYTEPGSEFLAGLDDASRAEIASLPLVEGELVGVPPIARSARPTDRASYTNNPTRVIVETSQGLVVSQGYGRGIGGSFVDTDLLVMVGRHQDPTLRLRIDPILGVGGLLNLLGGTSAEPTLFVGGLDFSAGAQLRFGSRGGFATLLWTPGLRSLSYNVTDTVGPYNPAATAWSPLGLRASVGFHVKRFRLGTGLRWFHPLFGDSSIGSFVTWDMLTLGWGG